MSTLDILTALIIPTVLAFWLANNPLGLDPSSLLQFLAWFLFALVWVGKWGQTFPKNRRMGETEMGRNGCFTDKKIIPFGIRYQ